LLVVLLGILVSHALSLEEDHDVKVVGEVQSGMPTPAFPPAALLSKVLVDGAIIAVVSYVVTYSLATLFANRHRYKISASQELVAAGLANVFGSFFSSLPVSTSLSRSSVQEDAGAKTLLTSATSVFLLLWVLLFAGPLFKPLPNAVLSAIIVQALKGMFKQFADLPGLVGKSKLDTFIWVCTFAATVLLGVDKGLLVGVFLNLVSHQVYNLVSCVHSLAHFGLLGLHTAPGGCQGDRLQRLELGSFVLPRRTYARMRKTFFISGCI